MSSNAVAAMAVILVSGFAGCAATARADEAPVLAPAVIAVPDATATVPAPHDRLVATPARTAPKVYKHAKVYVTVAARYR